MKADPFAQLTLLDLQELDSRADLLRHRRVSMPELGRIVELQATRTEVDNQARDARIVVDDLTVEQTKVDADVEQAKARRARDQDRMDQGLISNPKDLQRMQQEMESLKRRITSLEDDEIVVMERIEEAQGGLDTHTARLSELDDELSGLASVRDGRYAEIDDELAAVERERAPMAAGLPADLIALYDRLRVAKDGVGAAPLRARQCGGCNIGLDNAELQVIRSAPSDTVVRCEECSRILVRTSESGL